MRHGRTVLAAVVAVGSAALLLATIFPTDPPGLDAISLPAQIHRWAAAVMFVAVPIAGWLSSGCGPGGTRRPQERRVRLLSIACAATVVASMTVQIPKVFSGPVADLLVPALAAAGLIERILMVLMLALLVAIARTLQTAPAAGSVRAVGPRVAARRGVRRGTRGAPPEFAFRQLVERDAASRPRAGDRIAAVAGGA